MPGKNVLSSCRIWKEAQSTASGCVVEWSISGLLSLITTNDDGSSIEATTEGSVTETKSYTRIPFVYADYLNDDFPGDGEMWLIQQVCCCPCRLILWLGGPNGGQMGFTSEKDFQTITTIIEKDTGGEPIGEPDITENNGQAFVTCILDLGVKTTTGFPNRYPCRSASEGNSTLMSTEVDHTTNLFVFTHIDPTEDLSQDYEGGIGDTAQLDTNNNLPGILSVQMDNVYCNGLVWNSTTTWSGSVTVDGPSSDTTEEFDITTAFSFTLT